MLLKGNLNDILFRFETNFKDEGKDTLEKLAKDEK